MIGKTFSHYRIVERLGGGGMGVVYRAEDTRLKRTVALKFLPPDLTSDTDAKERFVQEAQAASGLQHQNICTVYDIDETSDGQMFIVMEYLPGETLKKKIERGPLEIEACIGIANQIAQGLEKAHSGGIIHRDIKPANVMVTDAGVVKIVDFGLAKLQGAAQFTKAGTTLGTAAYMSPEQVKSEPVDSRTDLWSLGAVLYEMVTGQRPFRGEHEVALSYSIVNENPVPIPERRDNVPPRLQALISRCLEKDVRRRFQNAGEVVADLQQLRQGSLQPTPRLRKMARGRLVAGGIAVLALAGVAYFILRPTVPLPSEKSIAVLPFVDMSPEKNQEYFCDGMTEEIINRLSNLKELKVPARTSVFAFKGSTLDIREIGDRLKVQTVLEGSVRKSGNQLRITAQLINVGDAFHLWSEQYDRELKDVFAIQSDVAQQIAQALDAALSPAEKKQLERQATANLDAYTLYLQGRFHWRKRTPDELQEAVACFTDAVRLDSTYALAYVGLADCYAVYPFYQVPGVSQQEAFRRAEESAKRALALDPGLAEAHNSLASVRKEGYWDWEGADREFRRAIELDPRYGTARQWYSENLMVQGRQTEALEEAKRAFELEPSSVIISNNLGLQYLMNRQYKEAIAALKRTIEMDPTHASPHLNIASAYFMTNEFHEAAAELRFTPMPPELTSLLLTAWLDTTKTEMVVKEIDSFAEKNRNMRAPILVRMYATLRQPDRTFKWLQRCCDSRDPELIYIVRHPSIDRFLPDPRYSAILQEMGLSPQRGR